MEPELVTYAYDDTNSTWIKKDPAVINIDRKHIFKQAAEKLALHVKSETVSPIKENEFIAKIEIIDTHTNKTMKFYGDFSPTEHEATQSAYNEAIQFFVLKKMLIVNDFNYTSFHKMESQLRTSETYLMFSEESETLLENELDFKIEGYNKLSSILNAMCKQNSQVLPISITQCKKHGDDKEKTKITFDGNASSANPLHKIAQSLVEMHKIISLHGYEPIKGEREGIREYRRKTAPRNNS